MSGWLQRLIEEQGGLGIAFPAMPLAAAFLRVRGTPEACNILLLIALDLDRRGGRSMTFLPGQREVQAKVEEARSTLSVIDLIKGCLQGDGADERASRPPVPVSRPDRVS